MTFLIVFIWDSVCFLCPNICISPKIMEAFAIIHTLSMLLTHFSPWRGYSKNVDLVLCCGFFFFFICWYTKDLEYFMILLLLVWTGYFKRHVLKFMFPPLDNGSCWRFHSELFISRTCLLIFHNLTLNFSFICPHHRPHFTHLFISSLLEHWCVFLFILFSSFVRHFMCVSLKFVARVKFF